MEPFEAVGRRAIEEVKKVVLEDKSEQPRTLTNRAFDAAVHVASTKGLGDPALEALAIRAYRAVAEETAGATARPREAAQQALDNLFEELADSCQLVAGHSDRHIAPCDLALCVCGSEESSRFLTACFEHAPGAEAILLDGISYSHVQSIASELQQRNVTVLTAQCCNTFAIASKANVCICSSRAIFADGGVLAPAGAKTLALAAKANALALIVVGSTHKLSGRRMPLPGDTESDVRMSNLGSPQAALPNAYDLHAKADSTETDFQVASPQCDFIQPELVSYFVLDTGTHVPSRIGELVEETLGSVANLPEDLQLHPFG
jgi:translation initiation factor 2B subunit (eIF-2B alpha/beta/delta family)